MSLRVTQRPNDPNTTTGVVNGSFTGNMTPWVNFGVGTEWAYDSNDVKITISSGSSKSFRQSYNIKSGITYSYSFDLTVSSASPFNLSMAFMREDGTIQVIRSLSPVDGTSNYNGTVVASADAKWVRFIIGPFV